MGVDAVYITFTRSKVTEEQSREVDTFLADFLPRFKGHPGVLAVFHYNRPEKGDEVTVTVWENEGAVKAYRQSALIEEPIAFESAHNLPTTREGYPLVYATSNQI